MKVLSATHPIKRKRLLFVSGLALALAMLVVGGLGTTKVLAGDCVSNSIIYCGESSASSFIAQVEKNDDKQGHHDLQAIYSSFGLEPASYDQFVKYARAGTAYKDGRIVVDSQTVATNTWSIGRNPQPNDWNYKVGNTTYHASLNKDVFLSDSIPVMVMFNSKGVMQFAVLSSCSNPITGSKVVPTYSCNLLRHSPVAGQPNAYSFSTGVSYHDNASIAKVVYDFGDGSNTITETNPNQAVTHTYNKAGTFTAKVTMYVNLPGNQQVQVSSGDCTWQVKVAPPATPQVVVPVTPPSKVAPSPFYQCAELAGSAIDQSKMSFKFVATAKFGNGAEFISADFDYGDGHSQDGVAASGSTATVDYTYPTPGKYTANALLHFNVNGQSVTAQYHCPAGVSPTQPPTPECKPGIAVGSPLCTPCQYDTSLPSDSPQCVPPVLPNTGAGNTIALFGAVVVGGFLIYRQFIFRRHKAAFMAADRGVSPLLNQDVPLGGITASRRHSLRRRRPF